MDLSLSFYKVTKDTDEKSFIDEESSKMLTDITKALKALNEEATIVEIRLPEQISEDTRERLKQVVTHFKAESMKDTGNYVLCSCTYDIYRPESAGNKQAVMFNDTGFLIFRNIYDFDIIYDDTIYDRYHIATLATDTGRDVISYLAENNGYRRMKMPKDEE